VSEYILVADEMGTPGMASGTSNTFVFGGYVVNQCDLSRAVETWRRIKSEMCGSAEVELKWKHFFVDADDPQIACPLLVKNPLARRHLAARGLDYLFRSASIIPAISVSRKDRATNLFIVQSRKGKDKIDDDLMWLGPVSLFAVFLDARKASGKLWFDRLGSKKHEERRQAAWSEQLRIVRAGEYLPQFENNVRKVLAIEETIEFLDSQENEAVQVADFVCGVIWQAAEGDEAYLARLVDKYGSNATRQGLGILHIE
jgi:hypothetical protein